MNIKLVQQTPTADGFYLVKFGTQGGLHLVLLQTELDGQRQIVSDNCPFATSEQKKKFKCSVLGKEIYYKTFPVDVFWSEEPIVCVM